MPEHPNPEKPKLADNPLAAFNLGLNMPPNPNATEHYEVKEGTHPDFNTDHFDPNEAMVDAARANLEATTPDQPTIDRIRPAQELVLTPDQQVELDHLNMLEGNDGQHLAALKVNWHPDRDEAGKITGEVNLFLSAWLSDLQDSPTHERIKQLALQSDTPLIAMNQPSQGDSDKLTKSQRQALSHDGDLTPTAASMLQALQNEGITRLNIIGTSMGAWTASRMAAMAHEYDIAVHEVVLIEPANTEQTTTKAIAGNFVKEGAHIDLYHDHPHDPDLAQSARLGHGLIGKAKQKAHEIKMLAKPLVTGRGKDTFYRYVKGMATGSLQADLGEGLAQQPDMHVTIANGGTSLISHPETVKEIISEVDTNNDGQRVGRVEQVIFSGEVHSVLEGPKGFAHFVNQSIRHPKS